MRDVGKTVLDRESSTMRAAQLLEDCWCIGSWSTCMLACSGRYVGVGTGMECRRGLVWGEKGGKGGEVLMVVGEKGEAAGLRRNRDLRGLGEAS